MVFSKTTAYGIRALAYLAGQPGDRMRGLHEIAEHERIPPDFLRKIMGELRRHRLVRSVKGIHGGYELARPPHTITLWEVFRVLEPDPYLDMCILGHGQCNEQTSCPLHVEWQHLRRELVSMLQNKTIVDVAKSEDTAPKVEVSET